MLSDRPDRGRHRRPPGGARSIARGDPLRQGDAHRWLSRLAWFSGDNATAEREAWLAVELLEPLAPGPELAMAYSNLAQLRMLACDEPGATEWGERAIELAERLGDTAILAHALNNVGTARLRGSTGRRPRAAASAASSSRSTPGFEEHVARAYTNLGAGLLDVRDLAPADALPRCRDRVLRGARPRLVAAVHDRLPRAAVGSSRATGTPPRTPRTAVLAHPGAAVPTRITPLVVIGRLRARRGDPAPCEPLDEALALARGTGEVQRIAPVAAARAEARWLAGDAMTRSTPRPRPRWRSREGDAVARAASCTRGAGAPGSPTRSRPSASPSRTGCTAPPPRPAWTAIGCVYEAALALAEAESEADQRRGLDALQALGARPAAARVARALRERGARDVRRGPRTTTRANPAGLTTREVEVLALVAEGLRNAEIAGRLFVTEKTVAHHVSAVLRKLDVSSRAQAGAEAARLGIVRR